MAFIAVNNYVHCMGLCPIGIKGVLLVFVVKNTLVLYHKRFYEGIDHRVCLRLIILLNGFV